MESYAISPRLKDITPIYSGESLLYFFDNATINMRQGTTFVNLLDYFPLLKQGYITYSTVQLCLKSYVIVNDLIDNELAKITPDDLLIKSFGSHIPSAFYTYETSPDGPLSKILLCKAYDDKLIPNYLNTFQVIEKLDIGFESHEFDVGFLNMIINQNFYNSEEIPELKTYVENANIRDRLQSEYILISEIYELLCFITDSKISSSNVVDILILATAKNRRNFVKTLLSDSNVDAVFNDQEALLHAITNDDLELVNLFLSRAEIDARLAYYYAKLLGNERIMDIISYKNDK